jgi:hypothetical protein
VKVEMLELAMHLSEKEVQEEIEKVRVLKNSFHHVKLEVHVVMLMLNLHQQLQYV